MLFFIPSQTSRTRIWAWGFHPCPNSSWILNGLPRRTTRCCLLSPSVSWAAWLSWASKFTSFSWRLPVSVPVKAVHVNGALIWRLDETLFPLSGTITVINRERWERSRSRNKRGGKKGCWEMNVQDILAPYVCQWTVTLYCSTCSALKKQQQKTWYKVCWPRHSSTLICDPGPANPTTRVSPNHLCLFNSAT